MATQTQTRQTEGGREELEYFTPLWQRTDSEDGAAFAIVTTFDNNGRKVARFQRSFRAYPTNSTDPKTEEHGH